MASTTGIYFSSSRGCKSKVKIPAGSVPPDSLLAGLRVGEGAFSKGINYVRSDPNLITSFNFNYLLKITSLNAITLRIKALRNEFWGGGIFQSQHTSFFLIEV